MPWQHANTRHLKAKGKGGSIADAEETQTAQPKQEPPRNERKVYPTASQCRITQCNREFHHRELTEETLRQENELQREISDPRKEIQDKICERTNKREVVEKLTCFLTWLGCPFSLRSSQPSSPCALLSSRPVPTSPVL